MNMSEETMKLRSIIIENVDYQMENISTFDVPLRIENVFTAQELSSGRDAENGFTFMDLSLNDSGNNTNEMAAAITSLTVGNEADIPTFEINDSDEDVIFVAEYINPIVQNRSSEIPRLIPYPPRIVPLGSDTSSSSASSNASPKLMGTSEPRRNPTRKARNIRYKKKCSEYITEEDLNIFIESDEENTTIEMVDEILPSVKETRSKKVVVVNNWPAEGLHERPEYNEQTEEIEKFDYSIRQIQNSVQRAGAKKPKKLKVPKKKYIPKKFSFKKRKNKNIAKKKEVEMVLFEELSGLINETFKLLSETFVKTVIESRRAGLHICNIFDTVIEPGSEKEEHEKCLANYEKLMENQSQIFWLGSEEDNFIDTYNKLKNKFEYKHN